LHDPKRHNCRSALARAETDRAVWEVCASPFDGWNEHLVDSYDLIAERYADHRVSLLARVALDVDLLDRYAASIRDSGRVCDLGCGTGTVARHLASRGVDVFGVDISPGMVTVARNRYPDIAFRDGDMRALDLPDESVAGVVSFYSILHLARPDVPAALSEMRRVLCPGGSALITAYQGEGEDHTDLWLGCAVSIDTTLFQPGELEALVEAAGLRVQEAIVRDPLDFDYQQPIIQILATSP
jgi:SAM-dependent methyltransferase